MTWLSKEEIELHEKLGYKVIQCKEGNVDGIAFEWIYLKHSVVLHTETVVDAQQWFLGFEKHFPNHKYSFTDDCYDEEDGYRAIFWRDH